jgi:hypothetical protein
VTEQVEIDVSELKAGLRVIRRRRWYLWLVILIYLPLMMTALRYTASIRGAAVAFFAWFVLLFVIALVAAVARCPRCGNYFHMHGMTLLPLRKCLHCQLHLKADKRVASPGKKLDPPRPETAPANPLE